MYCSVLEYTVLEVHGATAPLLLAPAEGLKDPFLRAQKVIPFATSSAQQFWRSSSRISRSSRSTLGL